MDLRDRLRKLRRAMGATQEDIAERGGLDRVEVSNLESGRNQATSVRILKGIAAGYGLTLQDASDLVDGVLSVDDAVARIKGVAVKAASDPSENRRRAAEIARQDGVSEAAVSRVLQEPLGDAPRSILWWAMRMKRLDLDQLMGTSVDERPASTGLGEGGTATGPPSPHRQDRRGPTSRRRA